MVPWLLLGMLALLGILLFYAVRIEPFRLRIRHHRIRLPGLGRPARILFLSDLHLRAGGDRKRRFFPALAAVSAVDLLLLGGDLTEDDSGLSLLDELLGMLRPRYGAYAVRGNHEHYSYTPYHLVNGRQYRGRPRDISALRALFKRRGVVLLENEHRIVDLAGERILVVGLGDAFTRHHDVERALAGGPTGLPRVGLTHSPEVLDHLPPGSLDLLLAGHTHGGQVRVPGIGPLASRSRLPRSRIRGRYRHRSIETVVTPGLGEGFWIRLRFLCPPEAQVLDLVPKVEREAGPSITARADPDPGE